MWVGRWVCVYTNSNNKHCKTESSCILNSSLRDTKTGQPEDIKWNQARNLLKKTFRSTFIVQSKSGGWME